MFNRVSMKKSMFMLVTIVLVSFLMAACGGSNDSQADNSDSEQTQAIEIKFLSAWGTESEHQVRFMDPLIKELNKRSGGRLNVTGFGPETVSGYEQIKAVQDGLYDGLYSAGGYHPEVTMVGNMAMMGLVDSIQHAKDIGLFDIIREGYKKHGLEVVAINPCGSFNLVLKNKPATDDLTGLKIRTSSYYEPMVKRLGGATVQMPGSELYSNLERGVIDGICFPTLDTERNRFYEVASYLVRPTFGQNMPLLMLNKDTWNSIPADLQNLIIETADEIAQKVLEESIELEKNLDEVLVNQHGMEIISLSPEQIENWYNKAFYEGNWEELFAGKDVEVADRMKEILDSLPHYWAE
jgi:TRAP-type C4-dicarboxylate transport system substrate-binding protein